MASRDEIIAHVDQLLDSAAFADYCPNGLQVPGADDVEHIAVAVSANGASIGHAARAGAQMLITHHGLFWKSTPQVISTVMRDRLSALFTNEITLAAWHLPLDAHRTFGNNGVLCSRLDLIPTDTAFAEFGGRPIGVLGSCGSQPRTLDELVASVGELTGRAPLVLPGGPTEISLVAICSGGAAGSLEEAAAAGADVLITGEPSEPGCALARELGITLIAAGHHATETFGVRALGEHLADQFSVQLTFCDDDNPV